MQASLILGAGTYAAARFLWDSSNGKAVAWGLIVAGVAFYLVNQHPASRLSAL